MVIPETVWIFETKKARSKGEQFIMLGEDAEELPLFVEQGSRLISFADFQNYPEFVGHRGLVENVLPTSSRIFVEDQNSRRIFVWLLRKHWEFYLRIFWKQGLEREAGKQRAYFRLIEGEHNTIVYDSPRRRGVRRDVVKRRGSEHYVWHENEGIAYSVVEYDGTWAIQLKPFYMFTGKDGLTPLPSFERTARATRRIRFDRNRNVDDDLTFWSRLLSRGNQRSSCPRWCRGSCFECKLSDSRSARVWGHKTCESRLSPSRT